MESKCVDTSLNLNLSPSRHMDVTAEVLVEELHRLSSEKKRLTEKLTRVSESYSALQKHLCQVLKNTNSETDLISTVQSRKRKAETENCTINNMFGFSGSSECSTSTEEESYKRPKDHSHGHASTPPKVSKVLVRRDASDPSLYVRDGYQWRKYGQKVTRENPSPRAYFKCSFAPNCPVKKKVQRSVEDPTLLVATYEGEHNHIVHRAELPLGRTQSEVIDSVTMNSAGPTVTLDHNSIHQFWVQQMASSLTRDPNFASAVATAISGRISDHSTAE